MLLMSPTAALGHDHCDVANPIEKLELWYLKSVFCCVKLRMSLALIVVTTLHALCQQNWLLQT